MSFTPPLTKGYWISSSWVSNAKKYFEALILPDLSDIGKSKPNHTTNNSSTNNNTNNSKQTPKKVNKKQARIRQRRGSDALPPYPAINSDLICIHGGLSHSKTSKCKRKLIDKRVWYILRKFYPAGPEYKSNICSECIICTEQENKEKLNVYINNINVITLRNNNCIKLENLLNRRNGVPHSVTRITINRLRKESSGSIVSFADSYGNDGDCDGGSVYTEEDGEGVSLVYNELGLQSPLQSISTRVAIGGTGKFGHNYDSYEYGLQSQIPGSQTISTRPPVTINTNNKNNSYDNNNTHNDERKLGHSYDSYELSAKYGSGPDLGFGNLSTNTVATDVYTPSSLWKGGHNSDPFPSLLVTPIKAPPSSYTYTNNKNTYSASSAGTTDSYSEVLSPLRTYEDNCYDGVVKHTSGGSDGGKAYPPVECKEHSSYGKEFVPDAEDVSPLGYDKDHNYDHLEESDRLLAQQLQQMMFEESVIPESAYPAVGYTPYTTGATSDQPYLTVTHDDITRQNYDPYHLEHPFSGSVSSAPSFEPLQQPLIPGIYPTYM